MSLPTISFHGMPEPEPGPIPAAAEELLRRRDHGFWGFADAPRDRTMLPELLEVAGRIREAATQIEILAQRGRFREGIDALVAAAGGARPTPAEERGETGRPGSVFVFKDRAKSPAFPGYASRRDRLAAEDPSGWRDRIAMVVEAPFGVFFEDAVRTGIPLFTVPNRSGGVLAPLTAAGLLPAACLGVDVTTVLDDARDAQETFDEAPFEANPAQRLAAGLLAGSSWAPSVAGTGRLGPTAAWLDELLNAWTSGNLGDSGVTVHLDPGEPADEGVVITGGSAGALIQTLLTGTALFSLAREATT